MGAPRNVNAQSTGFVPASGNASGALSRRPHVTPRASTCCPEADGHGPRLQGRSHVNMHLPATAPDAHVRAALNTPPQHAAQHSAQHAVRPASFDPHGRCSRASTASACDGVGARDRRLGSPCCPACAAWLPPPPRPSSSVVCCCCPPRTDALGSAGAGAAPANGASSLPSLRATCRWPEACPFWAAGRLSHDVGPRRRSSCHTLEHHLGRPLDRREHRQPALGHLGQRPA
mmetsp:Transcript_12064/g.30403  ORF Transcript_12064/g.30403 Transcript_12064/m.30403 type:complete len:231 (+) Transcript_12064:251-943(+)